MDCKSSCFYKGLHLSFSLFLFIYFEFEFNIFSLFLTQFKMLPELFQDDEKAISPTSATSSGRTPLTRIPAKPSKGRPGQTAKEHKKTVGHQVSSRNHCCGVLSSLSLLKPQVFLPQPPRWGERLELSLWERAAPSTPIPLHLALDLWLIKPFPSNVFCILILLPYGLPLLLFCSLVASSLDLYRTSAPSTMPSPYFWCLILCGEW